MFKPYAGVSTAILLFTKTNSGGTGRVWFYDVEADGMVAGRQAHAAAERRLLHKLDPLRKELLARRHKLVEGTASEVTHPQVQQAIARMLRQPDEGALSKLLIEVVLLECTDRAPTSDPDVLIATAKRHRVDVDKLRKAVEQEFTAKRAKLAAKQKKAAKKGTTKTAA